MDDLCSGRLTVETVYQLYLKFKEQLSEASFNLHKFESNSADLEVLMNGQDTPKKKILGLQWDKSYGTFIFDVKDIIKLTVMRLNENLGNSAIVFPIFTTQ